MRPSITRLMAQGMTYEEADEALSQDADDEHDRQKDEELERMWEAKEAGTYDQ
jgi:hypothetical protein